LDSESLSLSVYLISARFKVHKPWSSGHSGDLRSRRRRIESHLNQVRLNQSSNHVQSSKFYIGSIKVQSSSIKNQVRLVESHQIVRYQVHRCRDNVNCNIKVTGSSP
jgi:hypothetical protein